jgi:hypothetical protein
VGRNQSEWSAVRLESDEELGAAVTQIARFNGVNDPETLQDILLASMSLSPAP